MQSKEPLLRIENIHKFFQGVHALKGISLEIYPGEIIGLVGDNGAGKSTLIKIISGLIKPDRGKIFFKGKEVKFSSVKDAVKLGIITVFQDSSLVDYLTVTENLFMNNEITNRFGILDKKAMKKIAKELLRKLNLNVSPDQEVRFCSGGERQGIITARAMYFKSSLTLLDEPTRALSIAGVQRVLEFIKRLKKEGVAVVYVSHSIEHVYGVADRIVILSRGEKILDVPKGELSFEELKKILTQGISTS